MATVNVTTDRHRHDRRMIAAVVIVVWLVILSGFTTDMVRRLQGGEVHFPLVAHVHALTDVAWLVLLAAQVWLVRTGRVGLHRRLGKAGWALIPLMLMFAPATALVQAANPYMPDRWIAWVAVELTNVFGSVVLLAAGMWLRRDAGAHKRLMLMGTIAVTEPGFGRLIEAPLVARWGDGYLPFYLSTYIGTLMLVLAVGGYEVAVHRLHPAYVASALWIFANEALAVILFHQPGWLTLVKRMTGHPVP